LCKITDFPGSDGHITASVSMFDNNLFGSQNVAIFSCSSSCFILVDGEVEKSEFNFAMLYVSMILFKPFYFIKIVFPKLFFKFSAL